MLNMRRKAATKRALIMSFFSMLMCFVMLMGSTYAWFTDSATSGENQIVAGNLDVGLWHYLDENTREEVKAGTDLFTEVTLWEPNAAACEVFEVSNEGTLALKYFFSVVFSDVNYVVTKDGELTDRSLLDVIKIAVVDGVVSTNRDEALKQAEGKFVSLADFGGKGGKLVPDGAEVIEGFTEGDVFSVILYWEQSDIDNGYNLKNGAHASDGDALSISLAINLVATQVPYEKDSFDENYDKDAQFPRLGTGSVLAKGAVMHGAIPEKVQNIYFCEYDEAYGEWSTGAHVGATKEDEVRLFADGTNVYICVLPGSRIMFNENCEAMFKSFVNVEKIDFGPAGLVSTENVKTMKEMFYRNKALTTLDLSGFDVSNVTNMFEMFYYCTELRTLDLSGWDVSNVGPMNNIFYGCSKLETIYSEDWNLSSNAERTATRMFGECTSLPNFDKDRIDSSAAKVVENGGYFTAK